jgi:hypothetical protein
MRIGKFPTKLVVMNFFRLTCLFFLLSGCDVPKEPSEALGTKFDGSISGSFLLKEIQPTAAKAGDTLVLSGEGLSDVAVKIHGQEALTLTSQSNNVIKLQVPDGPPGLSHIELSKKRPFFKAQLFDAGQ